MLRTAEYSLKSLTVIRGGGAGKLLTKIEAAFTGVPTRALISGFETSGEPREDMHFPGAEFLGDRT